MSQIPSNNDYLSRKNNAILVCTDVLDCESLLESVKMATHECDIQLATDSTQIIPRLLPGDIDLLLLDIDGMAVDAVSILRQLRGHFSAEALPVIILSANNDNESYGNALAMEANDYLAKPFNLAEAKLRIKNALKINLLFKSNLARRNSLENTIKARTAKLNMLINSGLMMSMERNQSKLLQHILHEGQRLLNCDGATMYFVNPQKKLIFAERTRTDFLPFHEIALFDADSGQANDKYAATYAAIHKQAVIIDDVYQESFFDFSGTRDFDARSGYRTTSLLTVPMAPRNGEVIGVLQFINALDPDTGAVISFPNSVVELVEALAAQAAIALENLQLTEGQKATIENIIRVIAAALDTKSPHTGHHCVRVPELALMLAKAACQESQGPLADFNFHSEDEWFEFRVGAWLHDCGKVTTPEYVIDKATKLDMFCNRINEIRMRFEVLLRDAEINRLESITRGDDASVAKARFEQQKNELLNDFTFIAGCNLGKEVMEAADIERINVIAKKTWLRYFDDTLGLSQQESARRLSMPSRQLPAEECLLSDKWHQIIPRESHQMPPPNLGIKMTTPEHLYNYGEIYNLSIQKGTLTAEERFKINEHIIETIKMLEQLPFPEYLKRVPEYAATHHETLDGRGYPRGLTIDDLSIPARIMAIADIFEALTSSDRPYKAPYKLSEALKILHKLKLEHHIDPDLFDLFLSSGIYQNYAMQHLSPEQIDEVEIRAFLGPLPPDPQ